MLKHNVLTLIRAMLFSGFAFVLLTLSSFASSSFPPLIANAQTAGLTSSCTPITYELGQTIIRSDLSSAWSRCQCVTTCGVNGYSDNCELFCSSGGSIGSNITPNENEYVCCTFENVPNVFVNVTRKRSECTAQGGRTNNSTVSQDASCTTYNPQTQTTSSVCCYDPSPSVRGYTWTGRNNCQALVDTKNHVMYPNVSQANCTLPIAQLEANACCRSTEGVFSWQSRVSCFNTKGTIAPEKTTQNSCVNTYCATSLNNTTQCSSKNVGSQCQSVSNVTGTCQPVEGSTGLNAECFCKTGGETETVCCETNAGTRFNTRRDTCESLSTQKVINAGSCTGTGGNTGGGNNNNNTGGSCIQLQQACGSEKGLSNTCCGNSVCQGASGQRICQPTTGNEDSFCTGGGTCSAYYGFKCDQLHTSPTSNGALVCEKNGQLFTEAQRDQALAYAGQCGQIDKVCVGGTNPGTLCGEFQIINQSCTGPTPPPVNPTPTPTPPVIISCNSECTSDAQCQAADSRFTCYTGSTGARNCRLNSNPTSTICQPAAGPQCLSIRLNNLTTPTNTTEDPALGDSVSLTCGTVSLAQRYIFRVVAPDGTISNLTATGPTSAAFTISQPGRYAAQCQICTGAADSTCLPYEPITYSPVN